jgi:oligopeptide transport system permease protein
MVHLTPGDPFMSDHKISPETLSLLKHKYGLDKPLWLQYINYLRNIAVDHDFGMSYVNIGTKINDMVFAADSGFSLSIRLGVVVFCVVTFFGILFGVISAAYNETFIDNIISFISVLFITTPTIVLTPLLVAFFAVKMRWFPTCQWGFDFQHMFLPVLSLSLGLIFLLAQIQKNSLLDVLNSQYIQMARAKGLSKWHILLKHALKPSLIPVISYLGPMAASVLTGTVVIERLFGLPGMGTLSINAAMNRDYYMILALVIIYTVILVSCNTVVDILYGFVDPKLKKHE